MQKDIERILIVRTDRIGDVILTLPMAKVLKRRFPSAKISMLIRRYTSDLVANDSNVDDFITVDDERGPVPFRRLLRGLRAGEFDVILHTHPRFRLALLSWLARIPIRIGTGYRWYSFLFNHKVFEHRKDAKFHELEYNLHLLRPIGIEEISENVTPSVAVTAGAEEQVAGILRRHGVEDDERMAILHPGSRGSARNWSPENFGALAGRLSGMPDLRVVVTGGAGEDEIVEKVFAHAGPRGVKFVNMFSLIEYAALARRAALFVANSTGTLHIAAAVGTPVIGFYPQHPSLSVARWGPYTKKKWTFTPEDRPLRCRECVAMQTNGCACMDRIPVERVHAAALEILGAGSPAAVQRTISVSRP